MSDSHITLSGTPPRIQYAADGSQTSFTYPFAIFAASDLHVAMNGAPQASGFTVNNAGESGGGTVVFDDPPLGGTLVTLERRLPIERVTDFQEGGNFAARSLNNELDYLTACIQQVDQGTNRSLSYDSTDGPASALLPGRDARAGKLLGFDSSGNPIMFEPGEGGGGGGGVTSFVATGTGATSRDVTDKLKDWVSVKDFGAVGDGVTNDTLAIQAALANHQNVVIPAGTYIISSTIEVSDNRSLIGFGQGSILKSTTNTFPMLELPGNYATVADLRIDGGSIGMLLRGRVSPCVQNSIRDVTIWNATDGLTLDGYNDGNKPCYWNNFARVLIARQGRHGIHLTKTGGGDTPNANRFNQCRVYTLGAGSTGYGLYLQNGRFNNSFTDFEVNVGPEGLGCIRIGADTDKTLLVNCYTEATGGLSNIILDDGSVETSIVNLLSASDGAAIEDYSGGEYTAYNAGYPDKNRIGKTRITDLTTELLRFDTEFREFADAATFDVDQTTSMYLISAFNGEVEARLPAALDANGAVITFKKTDASANDIVLTELGGPGPDGRSIRLGSRFDYATVVSNGASWWLIAHNNMAENADFYNTPGVFTPDLTRRLYMVDAYSGNIEVRLPTPSAAHAVGRLVTIKRNDTSGNTLSVTKEGGGGPDNQAINLNSKGHALTVMSNGAGWQVISLHT
ncbi:MAG: glycosyl hydrolase family 28-related protein [Pseudomonadota bacterium]